jgi:hypothetical protein
MTEKEIQLLGFVKEEMVEYEGEVNPNYYYALDIVDGLTFITPSNDDIKNNEWYVEFFNTDPQIRFDKFEELQALINLLNKKIVTL